jgi:hypothetical protein
MANQFCRTATLPSQPMSKAKAMASRQRIAGTHITGTNRSISPVVDPTWLVTGLGYVIARTET